jgi:hypothetical protein
MKLPAKMIPGRIAIYAINYYRARGVLLRGLFEINLTLAF